MIKQFKPNTYYIDNNGLIALTDKDATYFSIVNSDKYYLHNRRLSMSGYESDVIHELEQSITDSILFKLIFGINVL